ncbi:MAG: hypothetical protein AAFQ33_14590 [Pseudomonadota bacterium]
MPALSRRLFCLMGLALAGLSPARAAGGTRALPLRRDLPDGGRLVVTLTPLGDRPAP